MRFIARHLPVVCLIAAFVAVASLVVMPSGKGEAAGGIPWRQLEPGLYLAETAASIKSVSGDSVVTILKIDPAYFDIRLMSASEQDGKKMTPAQWGRKYDLVAVTNAGMYLPDGTTSVGYMKNFDHENNSRIVSKGYNAALAFNPVDNSVQPVQILDFKCQDFEQEEQKYQTVVQSIRMLDCNGKNAWSPQDRRSSTSALATDKEGNLLMIFTRSPYSGYELAEILLGLPLSVDRAMYMEGGHQASLYLNTEETTIENIGDFESTTLLGTHNVVAWPVPNVIGVTRK